jgi:hypothetical protein
MEEGGFIFSSRAIFFYTTVEHQKGIVWTLFETMKPFLLVQTGKICGSYNSASPLK